MHPLTLLTIAVGLAMDAFAVSLACGLAFERREHAKALRIAFAFGAFQALMPVVGWAAGLTVRELIQRFDHWVAFALLAYVGLRMIVEAIRSHRNDETMPLPDLPRLLVLAVATSLDALAVGFSLSLLAVEIVWPAVVIGVVTFCLSFLGIVLGHELESLLRGRAKRDIQVVGGLLLVAIGIKIVIDHVR